MLNDKSDVFVSKDQIAPLMGPSEEEEQERFRALTTQLFAEADATQREPGIYPDPDKARIAEMIADKHRKTQSSV